MTEAAPLTGLEPGPSWEHLEALTSIAPRSWREEPVIEHVRPWAAERGHELVQDMGRNFVVRVRATPGASLCPPWCSMTHDAVHPDDSTRPHLVGRGDAARLAFPAIS